MSLCLQIMAQSFASPEEEIQFWKEKAETFEKEAKEVKEELEEFRESSRELEHELETQLEQSEGKIKQFSSLTSRLQLENEQLKDKLEQCHKEYHFQVPNRVYRNSLNEVIYVCNLILFSGH